MVWQFKSPEKHRKPRARAKAAYRGMKARCKNANGRCPSYANVELKMSEAVWLEWALPLYEAFITNYPDESPCVSRLGDTGHYEIANIEIISVKENRKRQKMAKPAASTHGSLSSYRYCKCELCRKANSSYRKAQRLKKKQTRTLSNNSDAPNS